MVEADQAVALGTLSLVLHPAALRVARALAGAFSAAGRAYPLTPVLRWACRVHCSTQPAAQIARCTHAHIHTRTRRVRGVLARQMQSARARLFVPA